MDSKTLQTNLSKLVSQRNIFLFFAVLLAFVVVLLSLLLFSKKERVVIVPTVGPSLWVEESKVSDTYLEKLGAYLGDLLLTRTPSDVDYKNKILLEHVHPTFYHEAQRELLQEKKTLISSNQTVLFRSLRSFSNPSKLAYVMEGELLILVGKIGESPSCAQSERKRFTFEFECLRGKLLLKSIKRENL